MEALLSPRAYIRTISIGLPPHTVEDDREGKSKNRSILYREKGAIEAGLSEVTVCQGVLRCHGKVGIESE
jgi:hypothetical protein